MKWKNLINLTTLVMLLSGVLAMPVNADDDKGRHHNKHRAQSVQLGPRPFYLVDDMKKSPLKSELQNLA